MSVKTLANSLFAKPGFQRQLLSVIVESVSSQFPNLQRPTVTAPAEHDWHYLITCASVLAKAIDGDCEDAALRIAQHCLTVNERSAFQDAACVILDSLTNRPAIHLAISRNLVAPNITRRLPLGLKIEWFRRELGQTVTTGKQELTLNRFQKELWNLADEVDQFSISAPTSSGKSFVLGHWLSSFLNANPKSFVIYIVPTRALIYQVETDLRDHFRQEVLFQVSVSSLPIPDAYKDGRANVFVVTQERLHILLMSLPKELTPNLLIVDEAQKLGDGARGVLLQNVIDALIAKSPRLKVYFASPMVSNPQLLLQSIAGEGSKAFLSSNHITVNQNLLWVSQVPKNPQSWDVELCLRGEVVPLGKISLPHRPTQASKRLTFVAKTLGDPAGGNLIYVNGAADAELAAHQLWDLIGREGDASTNPDISSLIDLVKNTIHPNYALATTLQRGVAFHYGNMPLLIRNEVERLFKSNLVSYLVCTSTLIEGVNLPCKSIFVRGPKKGQGKPMNETDFWNLAGRAGRLGKEFQGNIVCVDPRRPEVWKEPPPTRRGTYPIRRASDAIFEVAEQFVDYIKGDTPVAESLKHPEFDQLFTYLILEFQRTGTFAESAICSHLSEEIRTGLEQTISDSIAKITIPQPIIERNPGISPYAMERLLKYFSGREGPLEELLPVLPESEDSVGIYVKIFNRINSHLAPVFGRRVYALAILVVHWMSGYPLSRIIRERIHYHVSRKIEYKLATLIRSVMEDVEQFARFIVPKYLLCYTDALKIHLSRVERVDLVAAVPDVNVWLEFGASQQTQLSMMGLGLSRMTAVALSEIITDDNLTEEGVIERLNQLDLQALNLPNALVAEVVRLLDHFANPDPAV